MSEVAEVPTKPEEIINPFEPIAKVDQPIKLEVNDPVIKEKDKVIEEEKPVSDKPNEPEKIPTATPKDIPARTEEEKEKLTPNLELKFANETSEKIFNLLKDGKEDDVFNYLNQKQVLKNLDKIPAPDLIKLQIKNENKDYTPQEVDDVFSEKYSLPDAPKQRDDETEEEFKVKEDKYKEKVAVIERRIERHAKDSKTELLKLQQELVLPDIPKQQQSPQITEPNQEELAATAKARENYLTSIDDGLNDFKSIDAVFKDKDVEIKAEYKISADEKKELKAAMENFNLEQFIQNRWLTEDGKFNTAQQAKDIFLLTQGDKAIAKLVNEVGTKRHEAAIKSQRNVDYSGQHRSGNFNPTAKEQGEEMAKFFFSN